MERVTKDWAKVGKTTYLARIHFDNGEWVYAKDGPRKEFSKLEAAEKWLELNLAPLKATDDGWWGLIDKGTYEDTSFTDPGYGRIKDASWTPDLDFEWNAPEAVGAA